MTTSTNFIIYGLQDPITFEIRYIGKSSIGLKRPKHHLLPCYYNGKYNNKYPLYRWIKKLNILNLKPIIIIIQEFNKKEYLNNAEIYWIDYFKKQNSPLLNLTNGGDGITGYNYTKEHRQKISKLHKGKKRSELAKKNMSISILESRKNMDMKDFKQKVSDGTKLWWNNLDNKITEKIIKNNLTYAGTNKIKIQDQFGNIYNSLTDAAKKLNCAISSISVSIKKNKACKGYILTKVTI